MGEARIHMAINCASLSCPDLLNEPYTSHALEEQLEQQTQLFLDDTTKGVILKGSGLAVSNIFKWFADDFGGKQGTNAFIAAYVPKYQSKEVERYLAYNWSLNSQ